MANMEEYAADSCPMLQPQSSAIISSLVLAVLAMVSVFLLSDLSALYYIITGYQI